MIIPRRAAWRLVYRGIDVSSEINPQLIDCTYTDKLHGEADEIECTMQDKDGLWRGTWCPELGDRCKLWIGWEGLPLVYAGEFEIDEPEAKVARGDTFSFRGVSAPVTKSLRTKKTKGYENQSLKQITQKIFGEHGLTLVGTPPDVQFERVTQRRERDLQFLTRKADEYGANFTVKGTQGVFMDRDEIERRAPYKTFGAANGPGNDGCEWNSFNLKKASHGTFSKAKLTYFEGNKKKTIKAEIEDDKVKNGDTLRIDERVENDGQAQKRTKSELQKANQKKQEASGELVGDPYMCAGQTFALDEFFGKWAGKYAVKQSRHHLSRSSYTTQVESYYVG